MEKRSSAELKKLEQAARAAWLYYVAKNTQDEIAQKLDVSRQSAQRLVALAVNEGLIKVRLAHPINQCMDLASKLKDKFALFDCEVVPSDIAMPNSTLGIAQRCATVIERYLKSETGLTLAFGTGRTLKASVDELSEMHCPQHKIVSVVGNVSKDGSASAFDILVAMANKIHAKHYPMPLPVYASSAKEKQILHRLTAVKNILTLVEKADVTFVGIGQIDQQAPLFIDGFIQHGELQDVIHQGACGEITSWLFDKNGQLVASSLNQRVVSAPLKACAEKPVYGIASGITKVAAMYAALEGKLINSLITNEYTAEQLLAHN
ncbi:sugar-binding transcriptional regulator [Gayadomonas joobiniege]|uniref:sugar-binding transcriptional regulator n=1 Tax=Gayadomonas joobiniege TaxID=1234606 RepID=UPI00037B4102|nr:sugar-binding transcriptional regulator [Gayadomonas joobiniege]